MSNLALVCEHAQSLIDKVQRDDFPNLLIDLFKAMVPLDDASIIIYPDRAMPYCEYLESPSDGGSLHMDQFMKASFLLDPFYLASMENRFGFFQLSELAPPGFQNSEYYHSWYRLSGLHDECGYIVETGAGDFINISLGRTDNPQKFSRQELKALNDITPLVTALVQRRGQLVKARNPHSQDNNLRQHLQSALDGFGKSLLTERESQVVYYILHGLSTRAAAEKLSIAADTVKLHRRHAYAKLEIKSQAELFYLFLDSVMSVENYEEGDVLATYLNLRTSA